MERMSSELCTNILTSPFYNTNKKQCKSNTLMKSNNASSKFPYLRYDTHVDNMTDEEYCNFTHKLFLEFDRILNPHGTVLYNLSYGNNNRDGMFKAINTIITQTPFTIADVITWKKSSAMPKLNDEVETEAARVMNNSFKERKPEEMYEDFFELKNIECISYE